MHIAHNARTHASTVTITETVPQNHMQAKDTPESVAPSGAVELANTAVCRKCHKSEEQTEFSKSQLKRLRKGQLAICKVCREQEDGAASSSSAGAKDVQPRAGKAVSGLSMNITHNARTKPHNAPQNHAQAKDTPACEAPSVELANTAVCRKCHKSEEQTKFSKSQQKRLRKG